jgi:hypothetical protein
VVIEYSVFLDLELPEDLSDEQIDRLYEAAESDSAANQVGLVITSVQRPPWRVGLHWTETADESPIWGDQLAAVARGRSERWVGDAGLRPIRLRSLEIVAEDLVE